MAQTHHLSQLNIARMIASIGNPIMVDFVRNLNRINEIAEQHDGFVWRLKGEQNDVTVLRVFEDIFLIISRLVWNSMEVLLKFTYSSEHVQVFKRKKEWLSKIRKMYMVFWSVPIDHEPTPAEVKARLNYLNAKGETPYVFTFKSRFTPEDALNDNSKT